jgi:hypothetical protein
VTTTSQLNATRTPQDPPLPIESVIVLTGQTYAGWRDYILPRESELHWQEIAWRSTVADGVAEAQRQRRPVVLWIMNGHPLGNC